MQGNCTPVLFVDIFLLNVLQMVTIQLLFHPVLFVDIFLLNILQMVTIQLLFLDSSTVKPQ